MTPATTVFYLFVCEDALAFITPVYVCPLFIGQAFLIHLQEYELFPAVIVWITGGQLSVPIIAETHSLELAFHGLYICFGPLGRMRVILNGRILRRHSKGVPSHGMKHILTTHPLVSRHYIANGIIPYVPHMDFT